MAHYVCIYRDLTAVTRDNISKNFTEWLTNCERAYIYSIAVVFRVGEGRALDRPSIIYWSRELRSVESESYITDSL